MSSTRSPLLIGVVVLSLGCVDTPQAPISTQPPSRSSASTAAAARKAQRLTLLQDDFNHHRVSDGLALQVAQAVPEFAGFYIDGRGRAAIALTDVTRLPQVTAAIRAVYAGARPTLLANPTVVQARYPFADLALWYRDIHDQLGVPGMMSIGIDNRRNLIAIGAKDAIAADAIRARALALGIPDSALSVVVASPIHLLTTLRDQVRPMRAGIMITHNHPVSPTLVQQAQCTMGWLGYSGPYLGYVTNSHCGKGFAGWRIFGLDSLIWYQGSYNDPHNAISREFIDPDPQPCTMDGKSTLCRNADVSFHIFVVGADAQVNMLARTNSGLNIDPGTQWNYAADYWNMPAWDGTYVQKTGAATGTTLGVIQGACVDYDTTEQGREVWLPCQSLVVAYGSNVPLSSGGDSGSPVYELMSGYNVDVAGILWAGANCDSNDQNCQSFVFSPLRQVNLDLGLITRVPQ